MLVRQSTSSSTATRCLIMGIKAFNHGDDFVNKFVRAVSDSTGLDAVGSTNPSIRNRSNWWLITDYTGPAVYRAHVFTASGLLILTNDFHFKYLMFLL